ncbi:MAG: twin-arginine translocase TatA/TatE family subunit [Myxococcota bacterium]
MFGIGPMELLLILVVALLVFGPKRLPELARTLGRGMGEFRRASNDLRQSLALDDLQKDLREGLSGENSIHRPAQAGDSLPDVEKTAEKAAEKTADQTAEAETPAEAEAAPSAGDGPEPPAENKSGELPLGNDYEHNDVSQEPESADLETPAGPEPSMGDSELGNIPISRPAANAAKTAKTESERG